MLIEDDPFFQKFYAGKLREQQFVVTVAQNGEDGLLHANDHPYKIILLDLVMPIMDGFSFLEARQKLPGLAEIPVLVFSTLGQEQDIERAKALGANNYVNKSFFDFDALLKTIMSTMRQ